MRKLRSYVITLPTSLLIAAAGCQFDTSTAAAPRDGGDIELPDARMFFDDGAAVPDAPPAPDADLVSGPCSQDPFVLRPENGHSYFLETTNLNYDEAQAACMAKGGHLVVINDQAEDDFVIAMGMEPWIGFDDLNIEDDDNGGGSFDWVNGEVTGHTNWKDGQPNDNGGNEDCTHHKNGEWEDKKCGETRPSVCECDPNNVSAPPPACMTDTAYSSVNEGRRYRQEVIGASYVEAQASCAMAGGHLMAVSDDTENAFGISISGSNCWIGLDDIAVEDDFVWITGTPLSYENWADTEPNGTAAENCVEFRASGEWNDDVCSETNRFVCECDPQHLTSSIGG